MKEPSELELELHAYVDGNLDEEGMARIEEYLRKNPEAAVRVWNYMEQKDDLREFAIREASGEGPPSIERLMRKLAKRLKSRSRAKGNRILAAALLLVAGWLGHGVWNTYLGDPAFAEEVVQAHLLTMSDPAEVPPLSAARLSKMFARIGEWEHLPNLKALGFEPVGAELLPSSEGIVLHIPYRGQDGSLVSYFLLHRDEEAEVTPHQFSRDGVNLVWWQHDHSRYAIAAPLPEAQLASLVEMVDSALIAK